MNLTERLARVEAKARKTAARNDERQQQVDEQFSRAWQLAQQFEQRISQVETNTARIEALEQALAAHAADNKRHTGKTS